MEEGLSAFVNPLSARPAARFGPRLPIATGLSLTALALLGLVITTAGAPILVLSVLRIPFGLGGALSVPPATALLVDSVPADRVGMASGVFNTCRQLGGALAVAVFGALVAQRATFLHGLHISLVSAALLLLSALTALSLRPARHRADHAAALAGLQAAA